MSEANKNLPKDSVEQLKNNLEAYFLHTTFINVSFLKGEIAKHFGLVENNIMLKEEKNVTDDNGNLLYTLYALRVFGVEFIVRFNHIVKDSVEIEVPKVVRNEKKWWQFDEPDAKVIVEKQRTEPKEYWLLASFSC